MDRFWNVGQNGCINWKGNWEGIAPGWHGPANHDYYVPVADLATPTHRAYLTETHLPEKRWCATAAVVEFARIVQRLCPDAGRTYSPEELSHAVTARRGGRITTTS